MWAKAFKKNLPKIGVGHHFCLEKSGIFGKSKDLWGDSRGFVIVEIVLQSRFIIVKKDDAGF